MRILLKLTGGLKKYTKTFVFNHLLTRQKRLFWLRPKNIEILNDKNSCKNKNRNSHSKPKHGLIANHDIKTNSVKIKKYTKLESQNLISIKKYFDKVFSCKIKISDLCKDSIAVIKELNSYGFEGYFVGGAIRDLLSGHKPKDFDLVTNARPEEIKKIFGRKCLIIGNRFKLAHIYLRGNYDFIEVATFRSDNNKKSIHKYQGRIIEDNSYGNLEDDVWRRDFSINALYFDVNHLKVIDFIKGMEAIKDKKINLIGNPVMRLREDPVRIIRAIRFASKLGFNIDKNLVRAIPEVAPQLQTVAKARLYEEVLKLFNTGHSGKSFAILKKFELLPYLLPVNANFYTNSKDRFGKYITKKQKFLDLAFANTDYRVQNDLGINNAFLFAVLLWYPFIDNYQRTVNEQETLANKNLSKSDMFRFAVSKTIKKQLHVLAIPKKTTQTISNIWLMQFRILEHKRPKALLIHPKFKISYDFMLLLAKVEQGNYIKKINWWQDYFKTNRIKFI